MIELLKKTGGFVARGWMAFAHALGYVNTKILLTVFYVVIIGAGWLVCFVGRVDFLNRRRKPGASYWKPRRPADHSESSVRHQF